MIKQKYILNQQLRETHPMRHMRVPIQHISLKKNHQLHTKYRLEHRCTEAATGGVL